MPIEIYQVAEDLPGALFIMPRPMPELGDSMAALRTLGLDKVVSMLPADEAQALGLQYEAACCNAAGMAFTTHPITDFGLPDPAIFDPFACQIGAELRRGSRIAIHCRAGIGRSGMAVAAALITLGWNAVQAVERVSERRGVSIPDTDDQRRFLADFELRQRHG